MMICFLFTSAFSCTSLDDTDNGTDSSITDDEGNDDGGNEDEPDVPVTPDPDIDSEQQGSGVPEGYSLVWEDLFDDGVLDPEKWFVEVNGDGGGNSEMQFYRAENITEGTDPAGNGSLIITARRTGISTERPTGDTTSEVLIRTMQRTTPVNTASRTGSTTSLRCSGTRAA